MPGGGHPEFTFRLALVHEPQFDPMLADVAAAILRHVGYAPDAVTELSAVMQRALSTALADGGRECHVAFRAHAGELHIELGCNGGGEWSTSRPLP